MTDARQRRKLFPATAIGLLALAAAPSARAGCSSNVPGDHVFALAGDICTASPGAYSPTTPIPVAPGNIVGFFAYNGGSIGASGAVSITANPADSSYAAWSEGAGSSINLAVPVTITTSGGNSYGFYASAGGAIDAPDAPSITTTGASSLAVFSSGAGSTITTGGASDRHERSRRSRRCERLRRQRHSQWRERDDDRRRLVRGGRSLVSSISVTGTTITTLGNVDAAGIQAVDAWVAGAGATATLTNDTMVASGVQSDGVLAQSGGVATISGGSITVSGTDADGLLAFGAGSEISTSGGTKIVSSATPLNFVIAGAQADNSAIINLTDTSVATSGPGTSGVEAQSGGTANLLGSTVSTTGSDASAVVVNGVGSLATLSGANSFTTAGDGSIGLYALGGGVIDATGPTTISTGNLSTSTGLGAFGVDANGAGSTINLAATTVTTSGTNAFGLYANSGGTISAPELAEHNHVRKRLDRHLRVWRRVDHHRRRRFGCHEWRLSAGRAGRHRRSRDAERRFGDDHGDRRARGVRERLGLARDAQRLERLQHRRQWLDRTLRDGRRRHQRKRADHDLDLGDDLDLRPGSAPSASTRTARVRKSISGRRRSRRPARARSDFTRATSRRRVTAGGITVSGPLTVTTGTGLGSYGAWAQSPGSTIALNGPSAFTIDGGAFALYASGGGAVSTANTLGVVVNGAAGGGVEANGSGSAATLKGATTIALNGSGDVGLLATTGGAISAQGPTSIAVSGALSTGVQALSGSVAASGALNVTTSQSSSSAFTLSGTSPSIVASGGGTVSAAANAIVFSNADQRRRDL